MARPSISKIATAGVPIAVTAVVIALLPPLWLDHSTYYTGLAVDALVFASYGVGFNLIFGSTNQLFLCIGALAGVGGYGTAVLSGLQPRSRSPSPSSSEQWPRRSSVAS